MTSHLNIPVAYLIDSDISDNGDLVNPEIPKDKPAIVMLQAGWCPHCTTAKPAFQKLAEENSDWLFAATIAGDGTEPGEPVNQTKLQALTNGTFRGFPTYVGIKNGKKVVHNGGRDAESLKKFVKSL